MNIRYSDVLTMADRHAVMKLAMKEIAERLGVSVTFMAKPDAAEAGSSCHVHVSLWNGAEPAFPGEHEFGPVQASDTFRWFLGGWMQHVSDLMVFFAPTINSYKRFLEGSWAPTRTAGFRVVGKGDSLRIECRIPGADANPYLMYAAILAAGMDGIHNRIEPPPIFVGDVYQARDLPRVPSTLREATDRFAASEFVTQAFGTDVQQHYAHFFRMEQRAYDEAVTDWEKWRYFERI
jgi:glutamine synthetase